MPLLCRSSEAGLCDTPAQEEVDHLAGGHAAEGRWAPRDRADAFRDHVGERVKKTSQCFACKDEPLTWELLTPAAARVCFGGGVPFRILRAWKRAMRFHLEPCLSEIDA